MSQIREALQAYRAMLPPDSPRRTAPWVAEGFGDGPELADRGAGRPGPPAGHHRDHRSLAEDMPLVCERFRRVHP